MGLNLHTTGFSFEGHTALSGLTDPWQEKDRACFNKSYFTEHFRERERSDHFHGSNKSESSTVDYWFSIMLGIKGELYLGSSWNVL